MFAEESLNNQRELRLDDEEVAGHGYYEVEEVVFNACLNSPD